MNIKELLERKNAEVQYFKLKDIAELKRGKTITKKSAIPGDIPVVAGGLKPSYYHNEANRDGDIISVSGSGASSGTVIYWDQPIYLSDAFSIKGFEGVANTHYLYYVLKNSQDYFYSLVKGTVIPHFYISDIEDFLIPVPSLEVQEEMVKILEEAELSYSQFQDMAKVLISKDAQRFKYYREKLLIPENNNLKWTRLGDLGRFIRGSMLFKRDLTEQGIPTIHYGQIFTQFNSYTDKILSFVSPKNKIKSKAEPGDLLIATVSEDLKGVGKAVAWLGDHDIVLTHGGCFYKHSLNPKYVSFFFQTENFLLQKAPHVLGMQIKRVTVETLENILIPDLPLDVQEEIANTIDSLFVQHEKLKRSLNEALVVQEKAFKSILSKFFATSNNEPILI